MYVQFVRSITPLRFVHRERSNYSIGYVKCVRSNDFSMVCTACTVLYRELLSGDEMGHLYNKELQN